MKNHIGRTAAITLAVFGSLALGACDDQDEFSRDDVEDQFVLNFQALNGSGVTGTGEIVQNEIDDVLNLGLTLEGLDAGVTVEMFVREDATCPMSGDDTNADGFVDFVEVEDASGKILILVDSDITSRDQGSFPVSSSQGTVGVQAVETLTSVEEEARGPEPGTGVPLDESQTALEPDEELALGNRVVTVHGVDPDTDLPETVQSLGDRPATETLPVACAPINRAP